MKKFISFFLSVLLISVISAGIGIKWNQQSAIVDEGKTACLSYSVYNPFEEDTNAVIELTEGLKEVLVLQEKEAQLIPAHTTSDKAIPVEFCFEVPVVYERDYAIAGRFIDKLDCDEQQKVYEGEVIVKSLPVDNDLTGTGGSATVMSVGAPLTIRVACNPYSWNYTLLYVVLAVLSATVIGFVLIRKYRKPKEERLKEKLRKIKEEMRKSNRK